jgi:hypothetical protein
VAGVDGGGDVHACGWGSTHVSFGFVDLIGADVGSRDAIKFIYFKNCVVARRYQWTRYYCADHCSDGIIALCSCYSRLQPVGIEICSSAESYCDVAYCFC